MANTIEIKVPDIGDFSAVPVIEVLIKVGDTVAVEDSLITLESDKATFEVPASAAGKVTEVKVSEGDKVAEGDVVVVLEAEGDGEADDEADDESAEKSDSRDDSAEADDKGDEDQSEAKESGPESDKQPSPASSSPDSDDHQLNPTDLPHASPGVRKLARELGVDLQSVAGTGPKGRITQDDLRKDVKNRLASGGGSAGGFALPSPPQVDFSKFGETTTQEMARIQKLSAKFLSRNWVSIPHVTQHDHADITELEAFRKQHDELAKKENTRLTLIVFLIKACVAALKKHPRFNSSLAADGESLVMKLYFHVGVAVDTENGLVVPVIRNCDQKGLMELAHELTDLSERARDGKLKPQEMQGGCISISSLGGIGGTGFTPIINAPEVAILGVSRASMQPVWNGSGFKPRLMLPLSMSYDHRVIDGAEAARCTRYLATLLEDYRRISL